MEVLARPTHFEERSGPEIWVDEAIWGHRLHDEQSPWLTFLEFLNVLLAEKVAGRALREVELNSLSYRPQTQLRLRNLVFNNPHIMTVLAEDRPDELAWSSWLEKMAQSAGGLENPDFAYLRERFETFRDFSAVIKFLQGSAIEGDSNKRWSSKFVFPFGPSGLYEDVNVKANGGVTTDRRFFARTGEILYLMLCRSQRVDQLRELLVGQFLENPAPYDGMVQALQGEAQHAKAERGGAFLPVSSHPSFDRLADDWLAILSLPIPAYDAIPHLVAVTGLNLILYQLERASEVLGRARATMVCEIVSPKKSVVRDLSADSYQTNNALPQQAMERFIRATTETAEWHAAVGSDDAGIEVTELLKRKFDWPDPDDEDERAIPPDQLINKLVERAATRHKQHVGKVHMTWSRAIGLSSRRSSRRVRYAPTDRLLKTLVVACVPKRMEFKDFLAALAERYGLIIGDHQAKGFVDNGDADQEDFSDNARRLEERLASLGLLKRLSDSCAYVENPFQRGNVA
ncbi:hypothetical protein ASE17_18405 [Phenylobacterium sp. Root77]|uniref:hypothetical protein n=1 Tax=unclassified Phenylobacterium TaxID=2640670 RepID=UPI0006FF3247|nr:MULTISPECIES: hypothetical protein [unclassified Phenylobacterium]KQW70835.1 hypothetical protein ASC73_12275 [Phenylobacterium sp. Root1277]KQW90743.1 hypothetical protein ASC79_15315 [Phenylobacterium sp. Root1290]KRC39624.1 hypothetical protein ASE17_18405 [Phenylobacterium sp. Root77]